MDNKLPDSNIDFSQSENKIVKWFRNYWYYYKWIVIGIVFAVAVVLFCTLQTCGNNDQDLTILYAGTFPSADNSVPDMENAFEFILPYDFNDDGKKEVDLAMMMIYSEEQIKELEKNRDEDDPILIDRNTNSGELSKFQNLIVTGEYNLCMMEPWLFSMVNKEGGFMKLSDALGYKPENAVNDYAVRLSDTEFGKYYSALRLLPEDTYICIRTPGIVQSIGGKGEDSESFKLAIDTFKAILEFKAPEN